MPPNLENTNRENNNKNTDRILKFMEELEKDGLRVSSNLNIDREKIWKEIGKKDIKNEGFTSNVSQKKVLEMIYLEIDEIERKIAKEKIENLDNKEKIHTLKVEITDLLDRICNIFLIDPKKEIVLDNINNISDKFIGMKNHSLIVRYLKRLKSSYEKLLGFIGKEEESKKDIQKMLNLIEILEQKEKYDINEKRSTILN